MYFLLFLPLLLDGLPFRRDPLKRVQPLKQLQCIDGILAEDCYTNLDEGKLNKLFDTGTSQKINYLTVKNYNRQITFGLPDPVSQGSGLSVGFRIKIRPDG